MWQNVIVGLAVLAAAVYAVRTWLPAAWRARLGLAESAGCGACKACSGGSCRSPQSPR